MLILEGTKGMEVWSKKDTPLWINYRFFHVKNAEEITKGIADTLELEEKGPYKFLIYRNRSSVKFSQDENFVYYQESDHFYPDPEQEENKLDENVTLINVPALKRSLYKGNITMDTGKFSTNEKMNIKELNGQSFLDLWRNISDCNEVKGTDGTAFHPGISKDEILTVFNTDLKRSFKFKYSNDIYVKDILAYKFRPIDSTFSACNNQFFEFSNYCYCKSEKDVNFYKNGVQSVSKLFFNAPIYVSYPHYYLADQSFLNNINGLSPSPENHSLFLSVEPRTGLVIYGAKRIQINAYLSKELSKYKVFSKIKPRMFPIFWIEEIGMIDDENAKRLKNEIFKKQSLFRYILLILMVIFSILISIFVFKFFI